MKGIIKLISILMLLGSVCCLSSCENGVINFYPDTIEFDEKNELGEYKVVNVQSNIEWSVNSLSPELREYVYVEKRGDTIHVQLLKHNKSSKDIYGTAFVSGYDWRYMVSKTLHIRIKAKP